MMAESTNTTSRCSDAMSDMLAFSTSSFLIVSVLRSLLTVVKGAVNTYSQIMNLIISY